VRRSSVEIPEDLAAAIKRCWPSGVVEEFTADESYFREIRHEVERDLRSISDASLVWQTEDSDDVGRDDDDGDDFLSSDSEWQSYQVFFVSPNGEQFCFEDETIGDDPEDGTQTTYPGTGRLGLALTISLVAAFAAITTSSYSWFEDGSIVVPDPTSNLFWDDKTGKRLSADEYYRDLFDPEMFQKLEVLRQNLVSVMASHRISVLSESVLDLPVKGLRAGAEVFLTKPLHIRDAFFFRGV
jgi:hypothetical protein